LKFFINNFKSKFVRGFFLHSCKHPKIHILEEKKFEKSIGC